MPVEVKRTVTRVDADVLDARVQQLELGALILVVQSAAVPSLDHLVGAVLL